ncbi:MAG: hypothetical protein QOI78_8308 [Actinomycetota bacterium]|jgi:hypothetical protein|nr:hypothetical protein [Actinomycetota bacterium]
MPLLTRVLGAVTTVHSVAADLGHDLNLLVRGPATGAPRARG